MHHCCPAHLIVFEPGSFALAAYLLQSNFPFKKGRRMSYSCKKIKRFIQRHKHGLMDVAVDELADPTLDFVNMNSHDLMHNFYHIPLFSSMFMLYFVILIITVLV